MGFVSASVVRAAVALLVFSAVYVTCGSCAAVPVTTNELPTVEGFETPITDALPPTTPSASSCSPSGRNLTAEEFDTMNRAFAVASNIASGTVNIGDGQFTEHKSECYHDLQSDFHPSKSDNFDSKIPIMLRLNNFYHNLTRIANHTTLTLMVEEQMDLKLDSDSLYQNIWDLKEHLHTGTKLLKTFLNAQGYCMDEPRSWISYQIPSFCDQRHFRLAREMEDIHQTSLQLVKLAVVLKPMYQL